MLIAVDPYLIIIAGLSIIFGIVFGIFFSQIRQRLRASMALTHIFSETSNTFGNKKQLQHLENNTNDGQTLLKKSEKVLEDEVKLYQFEKDLVTRAIENILASSRENNIDHFERDRLLIKYKDQLRSLNENMERIQSEIDITKLVNLRNDFMNLLETKIGQIDDKIIEINKKFGPVTGIKIDGKNQFNITKNNSNYSTTSTDKTNTKENDKTSQNSRYPNDRIDHGILGSRELVDYISDKTNRTRYDGSNIEDSDDKKRIEEIKEKVMVALDRLDYTKPIEDEMDNNIESYTKINNSNNRQEIHEQKTVHYGLFNIDVNRLNDTKDHDDVLLDTYENTKNQDTTVSTDAVSTNVPDNEGYKRNQDIGKNRFPLASFLSKQEAESVKELKKETNQQVKQKEKETKESRNPLGNILKILHKK
ncbi:MAG: hypothetical protein WCB31_12865 [Nitrososphaeraceae archaeon]